MRLNILSAILMAAFALSIQSCLKDKCERTLTYTEVQTIFKSLEEIRATRVVKEEPRAMRRPGQIYYYNKRIYVVERQEGLHVIDNSHPQSPIPVAFINVPGAENLAIRNDVLFVNSYIDLLALDLENFSIISRTENVFPPLWKDVTNEKLAVGLKENIVTKTLNCDEIAQLHKVNGRFFDFDDRASLEVFSNSSSSSTGIGGSMARFTIVDQYLYAVDESSLNVFNLGNPQNIIMANSIKLGWGIETIFPYEDKLFIGSNSGMFIFDNSNPTEPKMLSVFAHANACDPVVVQGQYAYVTLRGGTSCQNFTNQLEVIDISDLKNPFLVAVFPMFNPHGLAVRDKHLFICEGTQGLKSFDNTDPKTCGSKLLDHNKSLHAFDVIALPDSRNLLLVIGNDGFYQFNYDDPGNLVLLSKIPVN